MATQPPEPAGAAPTEAAPARKSVIASLLPALLAIVAAPAASWAICVFVLIPRFKTELETVVVAESPAKPAVAKGSGHGKASGEAASSKNGYKFENIVVNLAGTMGTRYLKTTFLVTGGDEALVATFESNRVVLVDVTLNVLSSLSLTDLEEAGAKNLIREKLVQSYNQALGRKVAEQVFFSDFVVQ
jgi:flagellar FliL protein